jgi:hypothetical protein
MAKVYPPSIDELTDRLRCFIEWEMWYRQRMFPNQAGIRREKIREAEGALDALEKLEAIARRKVGIAG